MFDVLGSFGGTIGSAFINLSHEYPAILDGVFILFAAAGVLVAATSVFDVIKMGSQSHTSKPGVIAGKMIGGVGMIDLALWGRVWSGTIWANENPLGISDYVATGGDNASAAAMAALGIMVIAGYVTIGRAYWGITKLGSLSPDARSDMVGSILSRFVAGSALIASLHIARMLDNSTGMQLIPI